MDIIFDEERGLFVNSKNRPGFLPNLKPTVEDSVVTTSEIDICHSISYYTIVTGVVNALNFFIHFLKNGEGNMKDECINYISGMIVSVMAVEVPSDDTCYNWIDKNQKDTNKRPYLSLLNDIYKTLEIVDKIQTEEDLHYRWAYYFVALKASEIVRYLNSEPVNLRYGCSSWNRSTSSAFDPINAEYIQNESECCFYLTEKKDQIRITNLLTYTIGGLYQGVEIPGTVNALFFYTFQDRDSEKFYVSSSNLSYDLYQKIESYEPCSLTIKYQDYHNRNKDEWVDFPLNTANE